MRNLEKNKTCCFVGHRKIIHSEDLRARLKAFIEDLVVKEGVKRFLFGSRSQFDDLSLEVVAEIKEKYPEIKRVYVRSHYPNVSKDYQEYLSELYDDTYMPERVEKAGKASYVERNQEMIDGSDIVVFYYDEEYLPPKRAKAGGLSEQPKSGTRVAYEYAMQKSRTAGKTVINLFKGISK